MTLRQFAKYLEAPEAYAVGDTPEEILTRASIYLGISEAEARKLTPQEVFDASNKLLQTLADILAALKKEPTGRIELGAVTLVPESIEAMTYSLWADLALVSKIEDVADRLGHLVALLLHREGEPNTPHTERILYAPSLLELPALLTAPLLGFFLRLQALYQSATPTSFPRPK